MTSVKQETVIYKYLQIETVQYSYERRTDAVGPVLIAGAMGGGLFGRYDVCKYTELRT